MRIGDGSAAWETRRRRRTPTSRGIASALAAVLALGVLLGLAAGAQADRAPGRSRTAEPPMAVMPVGGAPPAVARAPGGETRSVGAGAVAGSALAAQAATPGASVAPVYGYRVVNAYPHDRRAFTQGLAFVDGVLYEGTGREGESTLRRVELETGEVLQSRPLDPSLFGEGIAVVGDRIYQLTWQTGTCFVYDRETFEPLGTFEYPTEGWGLTTDGERLIMSDGTSQLTFRDPETFAEIGRIDVRYGDTPVPNLNELEVVGGEVWANVWQTDVIARIDPATGRVTGVIDLRGLLPAEDAGRRPVDVLNGIAHDPATGRVFVTGKLWPTLFEIEVVPPE